MTEEKEHGRGNKREKHHKHHHHKSHRDKTAGVSGAATSASAVATEEEEDWDANRERIEQLCQMYLNNVCNDCNSNGTRWASVNHGVFVCIRCSGIHRSLGVHVSKIKSTNMDKWHAAEVSLMEAIGNRKGKSLYEARLPKGMKPMTGSESEITLKTFIQQKYQEHAFAVENVNEVLRQYYKQTRYGKKPKKVANKKHHHDEGENEGGNSTQREDTMKQLYGVNAEAISKKSRKVKPIHGTFGVVNVPVDEYEARRRDLLAHFHAVEPSTAVDAN
ncbi:ADP-ribosylation factor GTPase activating protein [Trypanosoma grayi]|uniref:ADP-ribosylation factor GTPase activating protein n=1 Tax=Trypanosoma grayi TaxID=71804 RepID=UPI0004F41EC2|nr:ADP-ribosylation factor GTPase activating protein [Trypanosoma grayi]KEG09943.1 ADP-ribosylation factor GTPase activating protein [Trypanosoma grayi]